MKRDGIRDNMFLNLRTITLLCFFILLVGCGMNEANWENGQGELSEQIGRSDPVNDEVSAPAYSSFVDSEKFIEKTDYNSSTGTWFGGGKLGYGIPSGTMEAGANYAVILFGHDKDGVQMDRDVRIQLTNFEESELMMEDIIHVDSITGEEEIYSNQLPDEENVVYLLSMEVLGQQEQVEDTMVGVIYVPTPEINAKLTTDKAVYQQSDEQATIILENFGPTFLSLGKSYSIEKKIENEWKVVPLDLAFEDIGIFLNPDDAYKQKMDVASLTPGEYRVIKNFNTDGFDVSATLAAEFTVE